MNDHLDGCDCKECKAKEADPMWYRYNPEGVCAPIVPFGTWLKHRTPEEMKKDEIEFKNAMEKLRKQL